MTDSHIVRPIRWILALPLVLIGMSCIGQASPHLRAGWGINMLTSPGTELRSSPGRTGYFGAGLTIGSPENKVNFRADISFASAAYRTRMAYRVHFVTRRSAIDLDLLAGFPQMNHTTLIAGFFLGTVTDSRAFVEQEGRDFIQGHLAHGIQVSHHAISDRAGVVLGMVIPVSTHGRLSLEFQLRQHVIPLVEQDQSFALVFAPEQQVLATNTRPTELTVGLLFKLNKPEE